MLTRQEAVEARRTSDLVDFETRTFLDFKCRPVFFFSFFFLYFFHRRSTRFFIYTSISSILLNLGTRRGSKITERQRRKKSSLTNYRYRISSFPFYFYDDVYVPPGANIFPFIDESYTTLFSGKTELQVSIKILYDHINHTGGLLVRQLRRKDYLIAKRDKQCDIITANLQAHSAKRSK